MVDVANRIDELIKPFNQNTHFLQLIKIKPDYKRIGGPKMYKPATIFYSESNLISYLETVFMLFLTTCSHALCTYKYLHYIDK